MKKKQVIFFSTLVIILCFWGWYFFIRIDKKKAIKIIMKHASDADEETLSNFGTDYLIVRAKAFRAGKSTFELDGKTYITATGKSK
jgi:hypothetical protein